jgi:hypothetical protein
MRHPKIGVLALVLTCAVTACKSPPAPTVTVFGLWPEKPPLRYKPFDGWNAGGNCYVWPRLNSAQPLLRWQPFPRPADLAPDTNGSCAQFKSVTYDLHIWQGRGEHQITKDLAYAREALPNPFHQVEIPLPRRSWYFWSVRARFELNGQTRVTEWSRIQSPALFRGANPPPGDINYPDFRSFRFYIR